MHSIHISMGDSFLPTSNWTPVARFNTSCSVDTTTAAASAQRCGTTTTRRPWRTGCATFATCTATEMAMAKSDGNMCFFKWLMLFSEFFNHFQSLIYDTSMI